MELSVLVGEQDFDPGEEFRALQRGDDGAGAVATFTGLVRRHGDNPSVTGLFLEHYPGMTEQAIGELALEAEQRWSVRRVSVIHRVGELKLGDQIVFVGVSASHRAEAFAACEFLMDALKTRAPFWKKEITPDGEHWVEQKASDVARSQDWK